jgi:hypothetical protein
VKCCGSSQSSVSLDVNGTADGATGGRVPMDLFACCRSRGLEKGQTRTMDPGAPVEKLCGLGIAFKPNKQGTLTVKRLVPGGPAALAGTVEVAPGARCTAAHAHCRAYFQLVQLLLLCVRSARR